MPRTRPDGNSRRTYRSPARAAQARQTRQKIVEAASRLFSSAGYAATTMRAVADSAGVSVASVELAFGTKAELLKSAVDVAIAGDHDQVAVLDREWVAEARASSDAQAFLAVVGRILRPAMVRSAGLVLAVFDGASTDPELAALAQRLSTQRATVAAWIVEGVLTRSNLRADISRREAADQVWLLMDPAVYQRLTRYRGWSAAAYEHWFANAVSRLLLDSRY